MIFSSFTHFLSHCRLPNLMAKVLINFATECVCVFFFVTKKVIIVRARIWVDDKSFVCYGQKVEKCVFPQKRKKSKNNWVVALWKGSVEVKLVAERILICFQFALKHTTKPFVRRTQWNHTVESYERMRDRKEPIWNNGARKHNASRLCLFWLPCVCVCDWASEKLQGKKIVQQDMKFKFHHKISMIQRK